MTTIIVANSITAALVVLGLAAVMRFGYFTAGGRIDRTTRPFELHRGAAAEQPTPERRAA